MKMMQRRVANLSEMWRMEMPATRMTLTLSLALDLQRLCQRAVQVLREGKKRKQCKGEVMEDLVTKVVKCVSEGLKESDKMFLELEEKE